jgi:hypothetical protein
MSFVERTRRVAMPTHGWRRPGNGYQPDDAALRLCAGGPISVARLRRAWSPAQIVVVAAGVLVLGQIDWVKTHLAAAASFGWVPFISGGVIVLAPMVSPQVRARRAISR